MSQAMADDRTPSDFEGIQTPWRRDPSELADQLGAWATEAVSADAKVLNVVAPDNGMSSESVLFDIEHDGSVDHCVARLAPLPGRARVPELRPRDAGQVHDARASAPTCPRPRWPTSSWTPRGSTRRSS